MANTAVSGLPFTGYRVTLEKVTDNPDTSAYYSVLVSCNKLDSAGITSFPTSVNSMEYVVLSETLLALRNLERATMPVEE